MNKSITFSQAINEATSQCMTADPSVYVIGLGVPDPKGVFGTTLGLQEKHGPERVMDMPCSESAMTGVAIGSAIAGMRPLVTHQRIDFALLALDQMVSQAANWHFMFGSRISVPLVIRLVIGRGWGQGPQHSQSLQAFFAHVPGLKVVMPATPYDAKGLLISSIEDDNPVIFIEHRWLHNIKDNVPEEMYRVPIGKARVIREGEDVTIAAVSYMSIESLRASELLAEAGISAEVVDIRTLNPFDVETVLRSVQKTGRLIVADTAWKFLGFTAEVVAAVAEKALNALKCAPVRMGLPHHPTPTSWVLARNYYPRVKDIEAVARKMLGMPPLSKRAESSDERLDTPDISFTGPF